MTTPSQAKHAMRRALLHTCGVRFSTDYKERCRKHFGNRCAYCATLISPESRQGHFDHATSATAGGHAFGLLYVCPKCNGDERREKDWLAYLQTKDGTDLKERKKAIEEWFREEPPIVVPDALTLALEGALLEAETNFDEALSKLRRTRDTQQMPPMMDMPAAP